MFCKNKSIAVYARCTSELLQSFKESVAGSYLKGIFDLKFSSVSVLPKTTRNYNINMPSSLKLTDYDVIGLDLDNTLLEYNITNLFNLQYNFLTNYLTDKKGYDKRFFSTKLSDNEANFIQRGVFLDLARGNLLKIRSDGYILKATHGTKEMDTSAIEEYYGTERKWSALDQVLDDALQLWDNVETRTFLDFTDSLATVIFAKAVDSVDAKARPLKYQVWPDLLDAIVEMYKNDSSFITTIASNMREYMKPCDECIITWLKSLKEHAKVVLITGAEYEIALCTLPFCLGKDYKKYFDSIIYHAKKPGFFNMSRPFLTVDNKQVDGFVFGKNYKNGNWVDLHKQLTLSLNRTPKCLYIGDNPLQDILAPTKIAEKIDVIAIVEEIAAEGLYPGYPQHPSLQFVSPKFWGSFIHSEDNLTLMGSIICRSSKLVIPSLNVLAEKPVDHDHICVVNNV